MSVGVALDWSQQTVREVQHPTMGVIGAIVVDSTALGPALGGCRLWSYPSFEDALMDCRRLARGMSYKNALAGLPLGGGKSVLMRPAGEFDRKEFFRAYARVLDSFGGSYITAEDVGTTIKNMETVRSVTPYVYGVTPVEGQAGGDPSPWTALGVFTSIRAVAERLDRPMSGLRVAIQGLGNVGASLAQLLVEAGAILTVADLDSNAETTALKRYGAKIVPIGAIHSEDVDVFAPCALGGILNERTVPEIRARAVVGAANNQLATPADGERLQARSILYAPDYVVNAGGVINVAAEYFHESSEQVTPKVEAIGDRLIEILSRAERESIPSSVAADIMAREIIQRAG